MKKSPLRFWVWGVALLVTGPLAIGSSSGPDPLRLPEVVVKKLDTTRLMARRSLSLTVESSTITRPPLAVDVPVVTPPVAELAAGPKVQSPGCAYKGDVTGAIVRAAKGAEAFYKTGLERLSRNLDEEAAFYFAELRAKFPDDLLADDSAFWLGEIARKGGREADAVGFFSLTHGKYEKEASFRRAWLIEASGLAGARNAWRNISVDEGSPYRAEGHYWLGVHRYREGDYPGSRSGFERAITLADRETPVLSRSYYLLGLVLREMGKLEDAEKTLVTALLRWPDHSMSLGGRLALAWVLLERGNRLEAVKRFDRFIDVAPPERLALRARFGKVRGLAELGRLGEAVAEVGRLEGIDPGEGWTGWGRDEVGWGYYRAGDYVGAKEWFGRATEAWSGEGASLPLFMQAQCSYLVGDYAEAVVLFTSIDPNDPLHATAIHRAGLAELLHGDEESAEKLFMKVLDVDPDYQQMNRVWGWIGEARLRAGRYAEAVKAYSRVDADSDAYHRALYGRGWAYWYLNRWDEAASSFALFAAKYPADPNRDEALLTEGRALYNERRVGEALSVLSGLVIDARGEEARNGARYYRGWMQLRHDMHREGERSLADLVRQSPDSRYAGMAYRALGTHHFGLGEFDTAISALDSYLATNPEPGEAAKARLKRADGFYNLGRYEEAIEGYRSLGESPENGYGAALCLVRLGRLGELEAEVEKFIMDYPGDQRGADLLLALGEARRDMGDNRGAADAFDQAARMLSGSRQADMRLRMAESLIAAGDVRLGGEQLNRLADDSAGLGASGLWQLGRLLADNGYAKRGGDIFDLLAGRETGPQKTMALFAAAEQRRITLDFAGAAERLEHALAEAPIEAVAERQKLYLELAEVLLLDGEPAEGAVVAQSCVDIGNGEKGLACQLLLGRALETSGQTKKALEAYLRIGYIYPLEEPEASTGFLRAGRILEAEGNLAGARTVYEKVAAEGNPSLAKSAAARLEALSENE